VLWLWIAREFNLKMAHPYDKPFTMPIMMHGN